MSDIKQERAEAARLHQDDVIGVLLTQHARIRELFNEVHGEQGEHRKQAFDELRALLAVHETAEEMIVRPVSKDVAGAGVADARNQEEEAANRVLADLEKMDVSAPEFDTRFAVLERAVLEHADREEAEEFPAVHAARSEEQLQQMGKQLRAAERIAPTHPHPMAAGSPTAQWAVGPFASIVDRVRDALKRR
jgi:hemerythrin superfamily protein